jgi:23S rRNA pseudouridine2605 synthase
MTADRLQKVLAASGVASRRAAETLIVAGRVSVDGRTAVLGERVDPATSRITVDGRPIAAPRARVHLALNKPAGVTSTVSDRHADRTVVELVPADLRPPGGRLYPVGRLDRDSEGLILLTNDGPWADRVLHPRNHVEREYALALQKPLEVQQVAALTDGIRFEEGMAVLLGLRPATNAETRLLGAVLEVPPDPSLTWYRATLGQGMKRQLRRMFGAVRAPLVRLVRVRVGSVRLDRLPPGGVRTLTSAEVRDLGGSAGRP